MQYTATSVSARAAGSGSFGWAWRRGRISNRAACNTRPRRFRPEPLAAGRSAVPERIWAPECDTPRGWRSTTPPRGQSLHGRRPSPKGSGHPNAIRPGDGGRLRHRGVSHFMVDGRPMRQLGLKLIAIAPAEPVWFGYVNPGFRVKSSMRQLGLKLIAIAPAEPVWFGYVNPGFRVKSSMRCRCRRCRAATRRRRRPATDTAGSPRGRTATRCRCRRCRAATRRRRRPATDTAGSPRGRTATRCRTQLPASEPTLTPGRAGRA